MAEDLGPKEGYLRVKIVSPTEIVWDGEADSVQIPTPDGVRLFIPKKAPLICLLAQGEVIINRTGHLPLKYIVSNGVCEIRRDICAILTYQTVSDS